MRIVIANPYFPPHSPGGAEHSLELLCSFLAKENILVHVITNSFDNRARIENIDGYTVEYMHSPLEINPGMNVDASQYIASSTFREKVIATIERDSIENSKPDILIANNAPCFIPVAIAAKSLGIPGIGIVRDTQAICETGTCIDCKPPDLAIPCRGALGAALCNVKYHQERGEKGLRPLPGMLFDGLKRGLQRSNLLHKGVFKLDHIVCISNALRKLIGRQIGDNRLNISVIGNISTLDNVELYKETEDYLNILGLSKKKYFLIAGKKSYGKGSDLAASAIEELKALYPEYRLLFVGKGSLEAPPSNSWLDCPPVSQGILLGLLRNCVALLIPGRWQEGLHRTMIDAVRLGVPIVCTHTGGPQEGVKDGYNGYVVEAGNVQAMAQAMDKILSWDEIRLEQCNHISNMIFTQKWSTEQIIDRWLALLTKFCKE